MWDPPSPPPLPSSQGEVHHHHGHIGGCDFSRKRCPSCGHMPKLWLTYLKNRVFYLVSSISPRKQTQIASIFGDLKSTLQYLHGDIGIKCAAGGLCTSNFERDIVDTSWHASRKMGSTRPNKPQFLLYEGKVWKDKPTNKHIGLFDLVWCVLLCLRKVRKDEWTICSFGLVGCVLFIGTRKFWRARMNQC